MRYAFFSKESALKVKIPSKKSRKTATAGWDLNPALKG